MFINSLAPGRPGRHFKTAIFSFVLSICIFTLSNDNALRWMPWDLTDDKSALVQVMAWWLQATSHYLGQCWPRSVSSYGVTRPQWHGWKFSVSRRNSVTAIPSGTIPVIRAEPLRKVLGYNRGGSGSWSAVKVRPGWSSTELFTRDASRHFPHLIIISCLSAPALQC